MLTRLESPTWALMVRALREERLTVFELADSLKITPHNVRYYLKDAHAAGIIKIVGWTRRSATQSGRAYPVYAYGRGVDVAKPVGLSPRERKIRERANPLRKLERQWITTILQADR